MAPRICKIYVDIGTRNIYDVNGNQLSDKTLPFISYKEKMQLQVQYLTAPPVAPIVDGDLSKYLSFAGLTLASSAVVDRNYNHYDKGLLNAGVSGAVTSIVVKSLEAVPLLKSGTMLLINSAGQQESVAFTNYSVTSSVYTFTVSATLTYTYLADDSVRVKETPVIKSEDASIDDTDKNTGLFLINLDGKTQPFQELVEGHEEIDNCKFEQQVYETSDVENPIFAIQFPYRCLGLIDDGGSVPPAPASDHYTKVQDDALLAGKPDKVGSDDIEITGTKGLILTDRTTSTRYRFFIDNGAFSIESL